MRGTPYVQGINTQMKVKWINLGIYQNYPNPTSITMIYTYCKKSNKISTSSGNIMHIMRLNDKFIMKDRLP